MQNKLITNHKLIIYLMIAVNPFKMTVVCLCLISINPFILQVEEQSKSRQKGLVATNSHPSLGFSNQTGSKATQAQISSFVNFINSASTYFRDDTRARLDYISDQMNKSYGISGYGFSVVQQGNQCDFGWGIFTYNYVYASVAAGVDKVFLKNSYMFLLEPQYQRVYFSLLGEKGSGITHTLETVIKNTILAVETSNTCYCAYGDSRAI